MLRDPRTQKQSPSPLEQAEMALREALQSRGMSFQQSVWDISADSSLSTESTISNYLEQSNIPFDRLLNVTHQEYSQIETGSIGITTEGRVHLKTEQVDEPMAFQIVFELKSRLETMGAEPTQLSLMQFWRRMSQAEWLVDSMKAGLPSFRPIVLISLLINLLALAPAIFSIQVYDRVIPNQAFASLWALGVGVVICLFFELLLKKSRHQLLEHATTVTDTLCTKKLSAALMNTETSTTKPSTLLQHLRSFESLREVITGVFLLSVVDVPFLVIFLVVIGLVHPLFLMLSALVIAISIFHIVLSQRRLSQLGQAQMKQSQDSHNRWIESLSCLPTLQSLGIHQLWSRRLTDQQIQQRMTSNEIRAQIFGSGQFTQALQQVGWVSIIALGAWLASNNELTVGGMIAASMLTMRCFAPIQKLQAQLILSHVAQSGFVELDNFIGNAKSISQNTESLNRIDEVRLNQVDLCIGSVQSVLEQITLQLKPSDRVGLIGPNGSGKTSLLAVLAGIHQPSQGGYTLNGLDTKKIARAELGKQIAYAEQPPQLIEGSLLDNIRMNRPWVTAEDCVESVNLLGLSDWIANLPDGLHHRIQVGGRNLSSGKKQMVSLARAFAGNPSLLLLDEPTVCLDKESESKLIKALSSLPSSTTLVLATHSLSLLEATDKLIMLENGRIKAHGARAQVLTNVQKAPGDA